MLNKVNNTIRTSGDLFLIKEDSMEKLTFTINGHNFSTAIDTAVDREHCIEEILEVTGRHYSWYKENTGNKNWILYDTEQYEVKDFDSFELVVLGNRFDEVKEFLHVKEGFTGKLHLPINSSACSFLFTSTDVIKFDLQNLIHQKLLI